MKLKKLNIVDLVKKPRNSELVKLGRNYESRLRLFTETKFKEDLAKESAWEEFNDLMTKAIGADKQKRLTDFVQFPLTSVEIAGSLLKDLYKVFDAGNSYFSQRTVKKNGGETFDKLMNKINVVKWIEETGKECLKNKPNLIVVIDKNEDGEPYLLSIDNDRLVDFEFNEDNESFKYIAFTHSLVMNNDKKELRISVYDEESYHVVLKIEDKYTLESSVKHNIGYCPAKMFFSERLNSNNVLNRKSPLSGVISKLQEWQFFDVYKFYTDHFAPFPVTEMVRSKCNIDGCIDGIIYTEEEHFQGDERKVTQSHKKCNVCSSNNVVGVGAKILLDPPEDGEPSSAGTFKFITIDTTSLEYIATKLETIEEYIKLKVVGVDDVISREAVNEKQVRGSFESRSNVLLDIKNNLDTLYVWIVQTLANCSIGSNKPLEISANFGTEWYLVSEEELQERFKRAKEYGFPKQEIDMIYCQLIETKYKGNPDKVKRLKLVNSLDPCPYDNLENKLKKLQNQIINSEELIISERLITFVNKFESVNGSILEFGDELENEVRVTKIYEQLKKYANEQINNQAKPIGGIEKGAGESN